jgi:di/tricarboxylate transporter
MDFLLGIPDVHMWYVLGLTLLAVVLFVREDMPLEIISSVLLCALLLFGQIFPLPDIHGHNQLDSMALLSGFANPSLIAVLALLVMGQAMIHTDALRVVTSLFTVTSKKMVWVSIIGIFIFVMVVSAFLNNTPLVIIAIPLLQTLSNSAGFSQSRVMIPLSFAAILGGMTTLIGSSTNLLVSSSMTELGYEPLGFFDFIIPGSILAATGFLYVVLVVPRLLPDRTTMVRELQGDTKEFVAELDITTGSKLIGMECIEGKFPKLGDLRTKLIQRAGHLILPPFEGYKIEDGDTLIIAATRDTLSTLLANYPGFVLSEEKRAVLMDGEEEEDSINAPEGAETRILAEIMISPTSRLVDMTLEHVGFAKQYEVAVLGIQRRARAVRRKLGRLRLEAGDVLLIAGKQSAINAMRSTADFIVLSGSKKDIPRLGKAPLATFIFFGAIASAAMGVLSIPVAAITGAVAMIMTGCMSLRQATRAIDRKIFLLVGAMLALGTALQATGGAEYIAEQLINLPFVTSPLSMLAVLFLVVALCTNLLTNNACAILFTPIAMNLANNISMPSTFTHDLNFIFAITIIFAANCSFASPIGYQTNLLVMGPGHYKFRDFIKSGVPLIFLLWGVYILIAKYYFGI